jgi:hypothetical protein
MKEKQNKTIKNKILGFDYQPWSIIKTYEFNKLKSNARDVTKLEQSIINSGFTAPFFVWREESGNYKDYVIDGTGRWLALQNLEKAGVVIPNLPIILIDAKNKKEAKLIAMQISSKHGTITEKSLADFVLDFDIEEIEKLKNEELNIFTDFIFENNNDEINFDEINSNENREKKFKDELVTCPHCEGKFNIQI